MLQKYYDYIIFSFNDWSMTMGQFIMILLLSLFLIWAFLSVKRKFLPYLYKRYSFLQKASTLINRTLMALFWIAIAAVALDFSGTKMILFDNQYIYISILSILKVISIFLFARLLKWIIVDIFFNHYYYNKIKAKAHREIEESIKSTISNVTKYIIYVGAFLWAINIFHIDLSHSFSWNKQNDNPIIRIISLSRIIGVVLIMLCMRLFTWIINELILRRIYDQKEIEYSHQFALNQLIKYFLYVITIVIILDYLGINLTIIWGSAAALLVGIGLGLQDTFKDFVSGIVLLFERSIGVGDVLEINDEVGKVTEIGIRASLVETNDKITVVVPNSHLVNITVNNWTNPDEIVRLEIEVSAAYGTDAELVENTLIEAALMDQQCCKYPQPSVLFDNFGNSSLDFKLLFFTKDLLRHRQTKSRVRFHINQLFIEKGITIPFPQSDVHLNKK